MECNGPLKRRGLEGEGLVTSVPLQVPGPCLSLLPGRHHSRFYPRLAMMYYLATGPKASGPLSHGLKLPKLGAQPGVSSLTSRSYHLRHSVALMESHQLMCLATKASTSV